MGHVRILLPDDVQIVAAKMERQIRALSPDDPRPVLVEELAGVFTISPTFELGVDPEAFRYSEKGGVWEMLRDGVWTEVRSGRLAVLEFLCRWFD